MKTSARSRRSTPWIRLAAGLAVVALSPVLAASAVEQDPQRPGTPLYTEPGGQANGFGTATNAYSRGTKQWVRLPLQGFYGYVKPRVSLPNDSLCRRGQDWAYYNSFEVELWASSQPGHPSRYGFFRPATVRTVAFGSIPVEATLQLEQPRDADGLVSPLELTAPTYTFCPGEGPHAGPTQNEGFNPAPTGGGELIVRVTSLTVDDVPMPLDDTCRTARNATLRIEGGKDWYSLDPDLRPGERSTDWNINTTRFYQGAPAKGGRLVGRIDIPDFAGCTSRGDDLGPLLDATIAGPDNPLEMVATGPDIEVDCGDELRCYGDPTHPPFPTGEPS